MCPPGRSASPWVWALVPAQALWAQGAVSMPWVGLNRSEAVAGSPRGGTSSSHGGGGGTSSSGAAGRPGALSRPPSASGRAEYWGAGLGSSGSDVPRPSTGSGRTVGVGRAAGSGRAAAVGRGGAGAEARGALTGWATGAAFDCLIEFSASNAVGEGEV